jgi:hypothetical protein
MTQYAEIMNQLDRLAQTGQEVRLYNIYKGIPLNYTAVLVETSETAARVRVNRLQAACLEIQRATFLQHPDLKGIVECDVAAVDMVAEAAVLIAFRYANRPIGQRSLVRVQPRDPIEVEIRVRRRSLRGNLADISVGGAGVYTNAVLFAPGIFESGTPAALVFRLPNHKGELKLEARVLNSARDRRGGMRLGLHVQPEAGVRAVISQYIAQRQAEIQRELRALAEALYALHKDLPGKSGQAGD